MDLVLSYEYDTRVNTGSFTLCNDHQHCCSVDPELSAEGGGSCSVSGAISLPLGTAPRAEI